MRKAVFLDRDGVLNKLVYNQNTEQYESPHFEKDLEVFPWVISSLKKLQDAGYFLFVISNQPSYAKGKTTLENIQLIEKKFHQIVSSNNITFKEYYYCYHHPQGIVKEYSIDCQCRKPKPYFIFNAKEKYYLNLKDSWIVGDRDTDIHCGQSGGLKTILVKEKKSKDKQGKSTPDYKANNLAEAVNIILSWRENHVK